MALLIPGVPEFLTSQQRNIISSEIPSDLVQKFEGFDYVNHFVIVELLNKAFDYAWSWEVLAKGIEEVRNYKSKNYNNATPAQDMPKTYYAWVQGRLTVPIVKNGQVIYISKDAFGGVPCIGAAKIQSQNFKSASSDALKKAASLFGFARNIYMDSKSYKKILEEEASVDAWTEQNVEAFKQEVLCLQKARKALGQDVIQKHIDNYCNETSNYTKFGYIGPSNISGFIEYMVSKKIIAVKVEESEA
jgi:hypothetical protein